MDLQAWLAAAGDATVQIEIGGLLPYRTFEKLFQVFAESMGPPESWSCLSHFWSTYMYRKLFKARASLNTLGGAAPVLRQLFRREIEDIFQVAGLNVKLLRIKQQVVAGFPSQAMLKGGSWVAASTATFVDERKTLFVLSEYKRYRDPRRVEVTPKHYGLTVVPYRGDSAESVTQIIELLLKIVQGSFLPMTTMARDTVLAAFQALTGSSKFKGPQPVAFRHAKFTAPLEWAVTPKIDGQRHLFFCTPSGKYLVGRGVTKVDDGGDRSEPSLFDCELVGRVLHVFDCYFSRGRDMRALPLLERIAEARARLSDTIDIAQFDVRLKPFFTPGEHQRKHFEMCLSRPGTDGVLFVHLGPVSGPPPLKYKPKITIDLRVVKRAVSTPRGQRTILDLYVGSLLNGNRKKLYTEIKFPVATKPIFESSATAVVDKGIYECAFDTKLNTFVLLRERVDKTKPNFETTAMDNFELTKNPEVPFEQ